MRTTSARIVASLSGLSIVLNPDDISYQTDAAHTEDAAFREQLHTGFCSLFQQAGVNYTLISGSIPERVEQIDRLTAE
jgi:hypothetical protein